MTALDGLQLMFFCGALCLGALGLGNYMARIFNGQWAFLRPVENLVYRLGGVSPEEDMPWQHYAGAVLAFNGLGFAVLFVLLMAQGVLPLNPQNLPGLAWPLAFNVATSFVTNTNWQSYAGETTLSYTSQMLGLATQNFLSAATGLSVALALMRGLARRSARGVGNFWVDVVRSTIYVLLPLSMVLAVVLVAQGVPQTLQPYATVTTASGATQTVPLGPVASQIAIKQLGTNGGGFFNANSAHPLENPTPLSNLLQMLSILLLPAALTITFGHWVGNHRQGWAIFLAMAGLFLLGLAVALWGEYTYPYAWEGKETRLGVFNSVLWAVSTTAASNGSVNAMHASLSPLAGLVALLNMQLGEVIFGGVGAGLYGMLMFVLLTVFVAGLMVGRTPEYLGKKIEAWEIKMAVVAILAPSAAILLGAPLAILNPQELSSVLTAGPHGLTEILYAFSSAANNNGSAFAGLNANTDFYNLLLGACMWIGRLGVIVPTLAIAGSLAAKKVVPVSAGTLPTDNGLFVGLLMTMVIIVGALTFFPALSLGPIMEHMLMQAGRSF